MINKILLIISLILLISLAGKLFNQPAPGQFIVPQSTPIAQETGAQQTRAQQTLYANELFISSFASHESSNEVHSAAAIELENNDIMAFWYGGTREGHKDVTIYKNIWDSTTKQWGQETSIISRELTRDSISRYIRKLGNPVVTRAADNSIWLFYVSVSVGGWAGSAVNLTISHDEGQSWSPPKRLIISPFLNLSTLLKGSPVHYSDGTTGVPVYHEFLGKFGELLKLDSSGNVIDKTRLSWGKTSLQPVIIPTSATQAISMMRYQGDAPHRILFQTTHDSGLNWSAVEKSQLPNPNAGIFGLKLFNSKQLLLAFNNDEQEREDMTLASSDDNGKTWQVRKTIEENRLQVPDNAKQFSYPWLLQTKNGNLHLLYTWHKSHIKHIVFNLTWLNKLTTEQELTP